MMMDYEARRKVNKMAIEGYRHRWKKLDDKNHSIEVKRYYANPDYNFFIDEGIISREGIEGRPLSVKVLLVALYNSYDDFETKTRVYNREYMIFKRFYRENFKYMDEKQKQRYILVYETFDIYNPHMLLLKTTR